MGVILYRLGIALTGYMLYNDFILKRRQRRNSKSSSPAREHRLELKAVAGAELDRMHLPAYSGNRVYPQVSLCGLPPLSGKGLDIDPIEL